MFVLLFWMTEARAILAILARNNLDQLLRINDRSLAIDTNVISELKKAITSSDSIHLAMRSGDYLVVARRPVFEQCYWEVTSGAISKSGLYGGWAEGGGSAVGSSAAYQRFYRLTCRFRDGWLMTFSSNWQW